MTNTSLAHSYLVKAVKRLKILIEDARFVVSAAESMIRPQ